MVPAACVILLVLSTLHLALGIDFVVFPESAYDEALCSEITRNLYEVLGVNRVELHRNAKLMTTWFWYIQASEAQKEQIKKWRGVSLQK